MPAKQVLTFSGSNDTLFAVLLTLPGRVVVVSGSVCGVHSRIGSLRWQVRGNRGKLVGEHLLVKDSSHYSLVIAEESVCTSAMKSPVLLPYSVQEVKSCKDANGPVKGTARHAIVLFHGDLPP